MLKIQSYAYTQILKFCPTILKMTKYRVQSYSSHKTERHQEFVTCISPNKYTDTLSLLNSMRETRSQVVILSTDK